jgi:drug/metabolite transporter (DMT)-like permease
VTVLLSLLAAVSFALGTVLQQRGALATPAGEGDPRFLAQLFAQPIWFLGALCQAGGWVLQTLALKNGQLVVVQGLVATSLVLTLPLGAKLTNQRIGRHEVVAAIATVSGLILFLVVGQPNGGIDQPAATKWWVAVAVVLVGVGVTAMFGFRRKGPPAAAFLGAAAGLCFGFQGAASKMFAAEIGGGLANLLTSWATYALIASALIGFAVQQSALKTGALAAAVASSNSSTLLASVVLGVFLFEENLSRGDGRLAVALVGLALTIGGVGVLAGARGAEDAPINGEASAPPPPLDPSPSR